MKTGRELLLDLPNGVRKKLILNLARESGYDTAKEYISLEFGSIQDFIMNAFSWAKSNERGKYWGDIYNSL